MASHRPVRWHRCRRPAGAVRRVIDARSSAAVLVEDGLTPFPRDPAGVAGKRREVVRGVRAATINRLKSMNRFDY